MRSLVTSKNRKLAPFNLAHSSPQSQLCGAYAPCLRHCNERWRQLLNRKKKQEINNSKLTLKVERTSADIFAKRNQRFLTFATSGYGRLLHLIIIIISTTMFMVLSSWQSHCESSPGSFDESRMAPSGRRPKTNPDDLGCESACTGCQKLHPPSPFIITQPESWYSFYRPTEDRRLSRPSWLVTYLDGLSVHRRSPIRVLTGSDVAQLRWSKPTCYH